MTYKKKRGFEFGIKKIVSTTIPSSNMIKEIKSCIANAKTVRVSVFKDCVPGLFKGKNVAYLIYNIGDIVVSDGMVAYKGKCFSNRGIVLMMKRRAMELNPDAIAKCKQEAKEWEKTPVVKPRKKVLAR